MKEYTWFNEQPLFWKTRYLKVTFTIAFLFFIIVTVASASVVDSRNNNGCLRDIDCQWRNTYNNTYPFVKCWKCIEGMCVGRDVKPCWRADGMFPCMSMNWSATIEQGSSGTSYQCEGVYDIDTHERSCIGGDMDACTHVIITYGPLQAACGGAMGWFTSTYETHECHDTEEEYQHPCHKREHSHCTLPWGTCSHEEEEEGEMIPGCCVDDEDCKEFGNSCNPSHCHQGLCTGQIPKDCSAERCITGEIPPLCSTVCSIHTDDQGQQLLCPYCDLLQAIRALVSSPITPIPSECEKCNNDTFQECLSCIVNEETGGEMYQCLHNRPCHIDTCNEALGGICESESILVDDGNLCTINHTCIVADDGIPELRWDDVLCLGNRNRNNMVGECHPDTGLCTYKQECIDCECEVLCDDGNKCTHDRCDHKTGCCKHDPIDCSGMNDECTVWACESERLGGGGCHPVWHRDCNDHNPCTIDSCEPQTGKCISTPRNCGEELNLTRPSDKTKCAWPSCNRDTGECFIDGPVLDDGNVCTEDLCDPITGPYKIPVECPGTPDACSSSMCMDTMGGCVIVPMVCDDGNSCTDDACDPDSGRCVTTKKQCGCDEHHVSGDACIECGCSNDAGGCFTHPVDCDDNNECTDDHCDKIHGCIHIKKDCGCDASGHSEDNWCLLCRCSNTEGGCVTAKVDCNDGNEGTVDWCDQEARTCMHRWVECPDDGNVCTEEKIDTSTGECMHVKITCNDNNACTTDSCDQETGLCKHTHICSCDALGPCWMCDCDPETGTCPQPIAKDCDDDNVCTDDTCDSDTGKCIHEPSKQPDGIDGNRCIQAECVNDKGGWITTSKDCRDGNPCTLDVCDEETGECIHTPRMECVSTHPCYVSECNRHSGQCVLRPVPVDDGDMCTIDACIPNDNNNSTEYSVIHSPISCILEHQTNKCIKFLGCDKSTGRCNNIPLNCDDMNECTIDTCNPDVGCEHSQVDCNDNNPCTIDDCSADAGGCTHIPVDCNDHDESTTDTCIPIFNGTGSGEEIVVGYKCMYENVPCDDGLFCTEDVADRRTGKCLHLPVQCITPRGDACIVGRCNEERGGKCVYEAKICHVPTQQQQNLSKCMISRCIHGTNACSEPMEMDCNDRNMCTIDGCNEELGVCTHTKIMCDDENPCTKDVCDEATGGCLHITMECRDGDACTFGACDPEIGECVYTQRKNCTSQDRCFIGGCDRLTGSCMTVPVNCDDSNWCTADSCLDGKCIHTPIDQCPRRMCYTSSCFEGDGSCIYTPIICNDNDARTIDSCNQDTGECVFRRVPCEPSEDLCMELFIDDLTGECLYQKKNCNDENPCTRDTCRRSNGDCIHELRSCDDGLNCTKDSCNALNGECVYAQINCNDMNGCTIDRCEESTGECVHDPQWNGGPEFVCDKWHNCPYRMLNKCVCSECYPGNGIWYESYVNCDDGNPCTLDVCDPVLGCINTPRECPEAQPCFIGECNRNTGRCENRSIDCNDGIPITIDYCNSETGKCEHALQECEVNIDKCIINQTNTYGICVATHKDCTDAELCTIDSCVDGVCIHIYKNCSDGYMCTTDHCDWQTGRCKHNQVECFEDDPCTITTCIEGLGCVSTPKDCSDTDPCTIDSCIPTSGECVHTPIVVDDGNVCTLDMCIDGFPVHIPIVCDDENVCTEDSCNTTTGDCMYKSREDICQAPDMCTIASCIPCNSNPRDDESTRNEELKHHNEECTTTTEGYFCHFEPIVYKENNGPNHECAEYKCDKRTGKKIKNPINDGEKCGEQCSVSLCLDGECMTLSNEACHNHHHHTTTEPMNHGNSDHKENNDDHIAFIIGFILCLIFILGITTSVCVYCCHFRKRKLIE